MTGPQPTPNRLRGRVQGALMLTAVVLLLMMVVRAYETQVARAPMNLKGNIATEGGMTANPPAAGSP